MLTVRFLIIGSDSGQTISTWREALSILVTKALNVLIVLLIGWAIEGWLL